MRFYRRSTIFVLLLSLQLSSLQAQNGRKRATRLDPAGIKGSLVIAGGGKLPEKIRQQFVDLAGGKEAQIVIIPTASRNADKADAKKLLSAWSKFEVASKSVLHTSSRKKANDSEFVVSLKKATGVWFGGGSQLRIVKAYQGTTVEKELHALLSRGGVIGGTSAGAAMMSKLMIERGNPDVRFGAGLGFLPGTVIDQHFTKRKRKSRLIEVLKKNPGHVGIGIDEETALIVQGRSMRVIGNGSITIVLNKTKTRPLKEMVHKEPRRIAKSTKIKSTGSQKTKKSRRRFVPRGPRSIADLTALRRSAIARTKPEFPTKKPPVPNVPNGSLIIVGGGGMTKDISEKFVEMAGGPDALIVILPTAVPDRQARRARAPRFLTQAGAKNIKVLPQSKFEDIESPEFLDVLKKAKGVWFGGGRQWRFIDAYQGTSAEKLFHAVLARGGVIGGSSAGASIQGGYLARANPLGNRDIMAEGYEKGLGFLPGAAIDQHFAQRRRFKDMTQLMTTYPQLLGIGLDEATAIFVQGRIAEVMGRNEVHFYNRRKPVVEGQPDYDSLKAGQKYDLNNRAVVK